MTALKEHRTMKAHIKTLTLCSVQVATRDVIDRWSGGLGGRQEQHGRWQSKPTWIWQVTRARNCHMSLQPPGPGGPDLLCDERKDRTCIYLPQGPGSAQCILRVRHKNHES